MTHRLLPLLFVALLACDDSPASDPVTSEFCVQTRLQYVRWQAQRDQLLRVQAQTGVPNSWQTFDAAMRKLYAEHYECFR